MKRLTDEQEARVVNWLRTKTRSSTCLMCGADHWRFGLAGVTRLDVDPVEIDLKRMESTVHFHEVLVADCLNCGFVVNFNPHTLGLVL